MSQRENDPAIAAGSGTARPTGGLTSWRSAHRSRNHNSAHAEDDASPHAPLDHPLVPRGAADLITDQPALEALLGELRAAGSFAYDTEFIGELTYHPILCLIQVATAQRIALIDPMANVQLQPFWELLADPAVEKIVHAGQQDIEPVARLLGESGSRDRDIRGAKNVVDTQIAAGFVGMAYPVALLKLVLELTGVKLGKGLTFTHWDQRPLSAVQLRYAADDVRYLPLLWSKLRQRLDALGHRDWFIAECDEMCDPAAFGFNPETYFLRFRGAGSLSKTGRAVLRGLTIWRDGAARQANVPPRALVKDDVLMDLARSPAKQIEKLDRVRGLPRPVRLDQGAAIVDATIRAASSPTAQLPADRSIEPSPTERFAADALFAAATAMCAARSIDSALITSRQELGDFFRFAQRERDEKALNELHLMRGWRRAALGEPLLRFIRGEAPETSVNLRWRNSRLELDNADL